MLELQDISKSYDQKNVIHHVSLCFRENEFVSIVGANGSGKTTLLNIIAGLSDYDDGDVLFNGQSLHHFDDDWATYRSRHIGFIFQDNHLIPYLSVLENIELYADFQDNSQDNRNHKIVKALKKVGLIDDINKPVFQLSCSQQQKVAIACGIVNDPQIILADEPLSYLDQEECIQIMKLFCELADDKLVIMTTHNTSLAQKYTDRVLHLHEGQIITDSHHLKSSYMTHQHIDSSQSNINLKTKFHISWNHIKQQKIRFLLSSLILSIGMTGLIFLSHLSHLPTLFYQTFQIAQFENHLDPPYPLYILTLLTFIVILFISESLIYLSLNAKTREIELLKSLGARKKDIFQILNHEIWIVGISAGLISIFSSQLLIFLLNHVLYPLTRYTPIISFHIHYALLIIFIELICISIFSFPLIQKQLKTRYGG